MSAIQFSQRPRRRQTLTGSTLREWKSADGRYIIVQITSPYYGTWYRAVRQYLNGQALISDRVKTRAAAEAACLNHRSQ